MSISFTSNDNGFYCQEGDFYLIDLETNKSNFPACDEGSTIYYLNETEQELTRNML